MKKNIFFLLFFVQSIFFYAYGQVNLEISGCNGLEVNLDSEIAGTEFEYVLEKQLSLGIWKKQHSKRSIKRNEIFKNLEFGFYRIKVVVLNGVEITKNVCRTFNANLFFSNEMGLIENNNDCNNGEFKTNKTRVNNFLYKVYPNPSDGIINVVLLKGEIEKISLFDVNGKLISSRNDKKRHSYKFFELKNGIYYLKVEGKGESFAEKIIVANSKFN